MNEIRYALNLITLRKGPIEWSMYIHYSYHPLTTNMDNHTLYKIDDAEMIVWQSTKSFIEYFCAFIYSHTSNIQKETHVHQSSKLQIHISSSSSKDYLPFAHFNITCLYTFIFNSKEKSYSRQGKVFIITHFTISSVSSNPKLLAVLLSINLPINWK